MSKHTASVLTPYVSASTVIGDPKDEITDYVRSHEFKPSTMLALRQMIDEIGNEMAIFKDLAKVPPELVRNFRNDMYLTSEALRLMQKSHKPVFSAQDQLVIDNYKRHIDSATKFIPTWVKVAVALALGLGTMVGWKRIVVTVGEKIGKDHLTYGQGAVAEMTAAATIAAADFYGLPVSTTHVLSSGIAGTMSANKSGLQMSTVRNIAMAWVLTLPASIVLPGFSVLGFSHHLLTTGLYLDRAGRQRAGRGGIREDRAEEVRARKRSKPRPPLGRWFRCAQLRSGFTRYEW